MVFSFNKPDWAAKSAETKTDFYRKADQTYSDIVAANEAARKHKTPPETPSPPRRASTENSRSSKKARLSEEHKKEATVEPTQLVEESEPSESEPGEEFQTPCPEDRDTQSTQTNQTPRGETFSSVIQPKPKPKPQTPTPTLNQTEYKNTPAKQPQNPSPSPDKPPIRKSPQHRDVQEIQINDDDDEIQEIPQPTQPTPRRSSSNANKHHPIPASAPAQPTPAPADDPVVQLLISSEIPNTTPLMVHRKSSQGLRDVRLTWCDRSNIPEELQSSVYLTWRGRRLFDVTTCKSLLGKPRSGKRNTILGLEESPFEAKEDDLHIHVVATTDNPDLLRQPARYSSNAGNENEAESIPPPSSEDQNNKQMKLILRSEGFADFKCKARPKTLVSKMISAFRESHGISSHQEMSLLFDGDVLEPESCLRDHDVADLDMLEIKVKW